jgi:hypothetical protein
MTCGKRPFSRNKKGAFCQKVFHIRDSMCLAALRHSLSKTETYHTQDMMKFPSIVTLATLMALVVSRAFSSTEQEDWQLRRRALDKSREVRVSGSFECLLLEGDSLYPAGSEQADEAKWFCQDENLLIYAIEGRGPTFFKNNNVISGRSTMWVSKAEKIRNSPSGDRIKIASNSQSRISGFDGLRQAYGNGINSLLVIRGISSDGAPQSTAAGLADDIFGVKGGGSDPVNLVTQYNACSNGRLQYEPAAGNTNITNGVAEVTITYGVNGTNRITAHNYFVEEAAKVVGSLDQWTQVMVVMQETVVWEGTAAYAYLNHWLSVYRNAFASLLMVQMHELGHNLGMRHSGEGNETYSDHTCMMGNPEYRDDAPLQCFNGAKSWFLGWYADRHITLNTAISSWQGLVVGIDDYAKGQTTGGEHYVVVKIDDTTSSTDLYMMYNKQEGVNSGVMKYPNKVTIVSAVNGVSSDQSWLVANLNSGQEYRKSSFSGQNAELVVKVCDMVAGTPDYARVLVYLDHGNGTLSCATPATPGPTPAPVTPTPAPVTPTPAPVTPTPVLQHRHLSRQRRHQSLQHRLLSLQRRHQSLQRRHQSLQHRLLSRQRQHQSLQHRHLSRQRRHQSLQHRLLSRRLLSRYPC